MKYALTDSDGVVINIIEYNGVSKYNPSPYSLHEINDWVNIGDHKDTPKLQEKTK